jgi:hypothetical protein
LLELTVFNGSRSARDLRFVLLRGLRDDVFIFEILQPTVVPYTFVCECDAAAIQVRKFAGREG